jgi:hypothetical protein
VSTTDDTNSTMDIGQRRNVALLVGLVVMFAAVLPPLSAW